MTESIADRLRKCWSKSDEIFDLLEPETLLEQPIALRHPLVFYVGHLPAFAWNQVCRGILDRPSFRSEFDELFERGIDPMGVDSYQPATEWPAISEIIEYRDRVRDELLTAIDDIAERVDSDPLTGHRWIFEVAIEHELMHQETLQYLLQQLPLDRKRKPTDLAPFRLSGAAAQGTIEIGGGIVTLGADFSVGEFGWDNEFPQHEVRVGDFDMDLTPVRNAEYREFVEDGGYTRPELWGDGDWSWIQRIGLELPAFWSGDNGSLAYLTLFDRLDLDQVADWPVFTSHAEARAYCRWRGVRLPTEAEIHRAAYTTPDGDLRKFPWGDEPPSSNHGNFDFRHWAPTPVGCFPDGNSAWGVCELVGNGWEWTDSVFEPFPGFEPYVRSYPGYSADFFDGLHRIMLGASWATPTQLVRRSFRNWFQRHYPFMFAGFRCVRDR